MLLKIVYLLVRRILGLAILRFRGDLAKELSCWSCGTRTRCCAATPAGSGMSPADRAWFAALASLLPRGRWAEIFPVTPATLLAWHGKLAARKYDTSGRRKPGRPPTVRGIARLVVRLAKENPLWGHQGIAQHVPDSERDAHPAAVTDIGAQQIRRKPILNGLINEYTHAA